MGYKSVLKNKKVLITCGPTWVPVDVMRIIGNQSTGTLGQMIAGDFEKAGAKVTLLEGPVHQRLKSKSIRVFKFTFFNDFVKLIKRELAKKYDVCVHAAAVSDYKIKNARQTKLRSDLKGLKIELTPTQKIIQQIKKVNPNVFLVGFKLEPKLSKTSAQRKSRALFQTSKCDLVVANSLNGPKYSGYILDKTNTCLAHRKTRRNLSRALVKIIKEIV